MAHACAIPLQTWLSRHPAADVAILNSARRRCHPRAWRPSWDAESFPLRETAFSGFRCSFAAGRRHRPDGLPVLRDALAPQTLLLVVVRCHQGEVEEVAEAGQQLSSSCSSPSRLGAPPRTSKLLITDLVVDPAQGPKSASSPSSWPRVEKKRVFLSRRRLSPGPLSGERCGSQPSSYVVLPREPPAQPADDAGRRPSGTFCTRPTHLSSP